MHQLSDILQLLVRCSVAVAIGAGFLYLAYALAIRVSPPAKVHLRWVALVAALLVLPSLTFDLLALLRIFGMVAATVVLAAAAALTFALSDRRGFRVRLARDWRFVKRVRSRVGRSPYRWLLFAWILCAAPSILHVLLLPPLGWDTLTYHGIKAGMYVQNGGTDTMIGTGPWAYYRNMPAEGEAFEAWAMLPLRTDDLVPLTEVAQWLALGYVLIVLSRLLSVREPFGSAAAGFFLALPTFKMVIGSGYVEPLMMLAFATGLTLGLMARRGGHRGVLLLSLGSLAVAAGTKLSMVPVAVAVAAIVSGAAWPTVGWTGVLAALLLFATMYLPWPLVSTLRTGFPFSPFPVHFGHVKLGDAPPEVIWYMRRLHFRPYQADTELAVLKRLLALPFTPAIQRETLGILALLPFAGLPAGLRRLFACAPVAAVLVVVTAILTLAFYYSPDFSMVRYYWTESSSRFLLPIVMLVTVSGVVWCRRGSRIARVYLAVLCAATFFHLLYVGFVGFSKTSVVGVVLLAAGSAALLGAWVRARRTKYGSVAALVIAVVALASLHTVRASMRNDMYAHDFVLEPVPRYWVAALSMVDDPDVPRRIAITSGPLQNIDNWFAAPFLGRALQNRLHYVPVSRDGTIWPLGSTMVAETADFGAWYTRLRERNVTDVMSFSPRSIEQSWMEARPLLFRKLAGDQEWALFAVNPPGEPGASRPPAR